MFVDIDVLYKSLPRETGFLNPTSVAKELYHNSLICQKVLYNKKWLSMYAAYVVSLLNI
jgi:hypothetical protein